MTPTNNLNIGWIIFSITLIIPGLLELYSAWKLSKFLKLSGSIMPFWFSISNGIWWTFFSLLVVFLAYVGLIDAKVDFTKPINTIIFFTVTGLYLNGRFAAALQSMFLSGILDENSIRRVLEKINNLVYNVKSYGIDLWEYLYNRFIDKDGKNE